MMAYFLNQECPQNESTQHVNEIFFRDKRKRRVSPQDSMQYVFIMCYANEWTKPKKMESKGTTMIFVQRALDHLSRMFKFYNHNADSINISNIVRWSDFNAWEAKK